MGREDILEWKVGAHGVEIKALPVEAVQLVEASVRTRTQDESDGHTGQGTVYAFKLSDLEDAATW